MSHDYERDAWEKRVGAEEESKLLRMPPYPPITVYPKSKIRTIILLLKMLDWEQKRFWHNYEIDQNQRRI